MSFLLFASVSDQRPLEYGDGCGKMEKDGSLYTIHLWDIVIFQRRKESAPSNVPGQEKGPRLLLGTSKRFQTKPNADDAPLLEKGGEKVRMNRRAGGGGW